MKPRCKVKAPTRWLGVGVPDDAVPGDLVVGNRGATARVMRTGAVLHLQHVGNMYQDDRLLMGAKRIYDNRGGT